MTAIPPSEIADATTFASSVTVQGAFTATGIDVTGNATFGDNDKAIFGAGSDLQIYHDGTATYISDVGSGSLNITSDNAVYINKGQTEVMAAFNIDGAVELYHDNSRKLATTSTGINVTGSVTLDDYSGMVTLVSNTLKVMTLETLDQVRI
jgi:hypothetical protein